MQGPGYGCRIGHRVLGLFSLKLQLLRALGLGLLGSGVQSHGLRGFAIWRFAGGVDCVCFHGFELYRPRLAVSQGLKYLSLNPTP